MALLQNAEDTRKLSVAIATGDTVRTGNMPIIVKDFTWQQTEKEIFISVPLKGAKACQSNVLCTEDYIKVRY